MAARLSHVAIDVRMPRKVKRSPALLLAHGAGAPMDSAFLENLTGLLVARGITVARFEFSYMASRRSDGKRRPPPKAEKLAEEYLDAVEAVRRRLPRVPLSIGGKSLGGRVASMVADSLYEAKRIVGCVCVGYPFHPPGRPDVLRTAHLAALACPTLIVQGERDPFGSSAEVRRLALAPEISVAWVRDGDHDLKPRAASGATAAGNLAAAATAVAEFAHARSAAGR